MKKLALFVILFSLPMFGQETLPTNSTSIKPYYFKAPNGDIYHAVGSTVYKVAKFSDIAAGVSNATETIAGVAAIATQTLTNGGVDDSTIISPKKLKAYVATYSELLANKQNSLSVDGTGTKYGTVDAVNAALALKAPLASPGLTGVPTAPTATTGTTGTQIATLDYSLAVASAATSTKQNLLPAGTTSQYYDGTGSLQSFDTRIRASAIGTATGVSTPVINTTTFQQAIWNLQAQLNTLNNPPTTSKSADYTLTANDYTVKLSAGSFTFTLPTAVGIKGKIFVLKNKGTGVLTVATTSSQTIDGTTTKTYGTPNSGVMVQSDGANWDVIGSF